MKLLKKVFVTWKEEFWSIPLALIIFFASPIVLRWVDPTCGTYDSGVLQDALIAIIFLLVFNGLAWAGVRSVFPEIFQFFQVKFKIIFSELDSWQKVKISLLIYFVYLLSLVFLVRVI